MGDNAEVRMNLPPPIEATTCVNLFHRLASFTPKEKAKMDRKTQFLTAIRVELAKYPWASDAKRMEHTMLLVKDTLDGSRKCLIDGPSWKTAWKAIGMKGNPTYKSLHAL